MIAQAPAWLSSQLHEQWEIHGATAGIVRGSCEELLDRLPEASIDLVLTDPPYFIDKMGGDWDKEKIKASQGRAGVVGSMPVGMKFDPEQGRKLQRELTPVFTQCLRVLKPGGFLVSFSQARLYHRMAMAAEEAGFEIRDMFGWTYRGQAKAFSQDHFIKRMGLPAEEESRLLASLANRKTPQLMPMIEPMVFGQKPKDGTFVENWKRHQVGLVDVSQKWDGGFPGNLMNCAKPSKEERGPGNNHPSVKPQKVLRHLIELLTVPGAVVLDPYVGSGSTLLAALDAHRHGMGIEREQEDFETARRRLSERVRAAISGNVSAR